MADKRRIPAPLFFITNYTNKLHGLRQFATLVNTDGLKECLCIKYKRGITNGPDQSEQYMQDGFFGFTDNVFTERVTADFIYSILSLD